MVQKGKLAASALLFEIALNKVDFPTFGNPTIPHLSPIKLIKGANRNQQLKESERRLKSATKTSTGAKTKDHRHIQGLSEYRFKFRLVLFKFRINLGGPYGSRLGGSSSFFTLTC